MKTKTSVNMYFFICLIFYFYQNWRMLYQKQSETHKISHQVLNSSVSTRNIYLQEDLYIFINHIWTATLNLLPFIFRPCQPVILKLKSELRMELFLNWCKLIKVKGFEKHSVIIVIATDVAATLKSFWRMFYKNVFIHVICQKNSCIVLL